MTARVTPEPEEPVLVEDGEEETNRERSGRGGNVPRRSAFHPFSGVIILVVDNFFFGVKVVSGFTLTALTITLAFSVTAAGVWLVQRKLAGDSPGQAAAKALLAGVIAGIPTSIAGTFVGAWVLAQSGLNPWRKFFR